MNFSDSYEHMNRFYDSFESMHTWISTALCVGGLLANLITICILSRPHMLSIVNKLLTAIACFDSLLLSLYLAYVIHYKILLDDRCPATALSYNWTLFAMIYANFSVVLRAVSLWLSVVIAAYRKTVLYSFQPLKHYSESYAFAYKSITVVVAAVTVASVPIFVGNSIREEMIPPEAMCHNETLTFYRIVQSKWFKVNYFLNAFLLKLFPCCFLTYYLISIIQFVYKQSKFRKRLLSASASGNTTISDGSLSGKMFSSVRRRLSLQCGKPFQQFHPTSLILSSIMLMTILCEMPNAVTSALSGVLSTDFYGMVYRNLGDVFDVLSLFNGFTTFLMYCSMSRSFRVTVVAFFCRSESPPSGVDTLPIGMLSSFKRQSVEFFDKHDRNRFKSGMLICRRDGNFTKPLESLDAVNGCTALSENCKFVVAKDYEPCNNGGVAFI